jgi:DNA invertase Pin-like site-specific DNA recombinase
MSAAVYTYSARAVPEAHDHQRVECERLADELGYETVLSYQDGSGARDALERLLADAREGTVSALFIVSLDRLGRRVQAVTSVLERLRDAGVDLYAATNGTTCLSASPAAETLLALAASYQDAHTANITR